MSSAGMETMDLDDEKETPTIFLLLENPTKNNNLGPFIRCASAFGISTIVAVGFAKCSEKGSHGASKNVELIDFPTCDQALEFLRNNCECQSVVGLLGPLPGGYDSKGYSLGEKDSSVIALRSGGCEIKSSRVSFPLNTFPFEKGNICFAVSKLSEGLPLSLARFCDSFIHIPHPRTLGERPLIDPPACLSILLHEFTSWAGYNERTFQGHKFDVVRPGPADASDIARRRAKRAANRNSMGQEAEMLRGDLMGEQLFSFENKYHDGDY